MGQAFGARVPGAAAGEFLARYPAVLPDWHFDNRQVDLIGEGFDAAIGGGIELTPGVVARELARIHVVAVAAPALPGRQADARRTRRTWPASTASCGAPRPPGACAPGRCATRAGDEVRWSRSRASIFSDPEAMCRAAIDGPGRRAAADALRAAGCRAARWCACCRAGMPTPGPSRSTTRARSCCRRRRACSSTSWWSGSGRRALRSACTGLARHPDESIASPLVSPARRRVGPRQPSRPAIESSLPACHWRTAVDAPRPTCMQRRSLERLGFLYPGFRSRHSPKDWWMGIAPRAARRAIFVAGRVRSPNCYPPPPSCTHMLRRTNQHSSKDAGRPQSKSHCPTSLVNFWISVSGVRSWVVFVPNKPPAIAAAPMKARQRAVVPQG